jgi:hypothetical protein
LDFDHAHTLCEGLQGLADHRADALALLWALHGVAGDGRAHQQIAHGDRPILRRHLDGDAPREREDRAGIVALGALVAQHDPRSRGDHASDAGAEGFAGLAELSGVVWINLDDVAGFDGFADVNALGDVGAVAGERAVGVDVPRGALDAEDQILRPLPRIRIASNRFPVGKSPVKNLISLGTLPGPLPLTKAM